MQRKPKTGPDSIDAHVGRRLRDRRILLGLTQTAVADSIGLSFQQVQKYERGANRISAGRLYQFAQLLDVSIDYFFEGGVGQDAGGSPPSEDPALTREVLSFVQAYHAIDDKDVRQSILELTKALADRAEET